MQAKFYMNSGNHLWDAMKGKICQAILDNLCGELNPRYRIHFDKMLFSIGWFLGYAEIWKGKMPYERRRRKIPFVLHVTDWGRREDCRKRPDYRVDKGDLKWTM